MRITIELPDELLARARASAAQRGLSLEEVLIEAVEQRLAPKRTKTRTDPPVIGGPDAPKIGVLTAEQVDEAMFGSAPLRRRKPGCGG